MDQYGHQPIGAATTAKLNAYVYCVCVCGLHCHVCGHGSDKLNINTGLNVNIKSLELVDEAMLLQQQFAHYATHTHTHSLNVSFVFVYSDEITYYGFFSLECCIWHATR